MTNPTAELIALLEHSLADAKFRRYSCQITCNSSEAPHCICDSHIDKIENATHHFKSTGQDGLRVVPAALIEAGNSLLKRAGPAWQGICKVEAGALDELAEWLRVGGERD